MHKITLFEVHCFLWRVYDILECRYTMVFHS